jgi:hypothetical protein
VLTVIGIRPHRRIEDLTPDELSLEAGVREREKDLKLRISSEMSNSSFFP